MSHEEPGRERSGLALRFGRDYPNFPEVSGTTLPLLSTVLAGFAVTIIVQLVLRPNVTDDLPRRVEIALIAFLLSTLLFLSSTVFAINAQANNYLRFLDLSDGGARLLSVDDVGDWLRRMERRWYVYHLATLSSFYGGVILVLAGMTLIVWVFVGATVAAVFLGALVLSLGVNVGVGLLAGRLSERGRHGRR